MKYHGQCAAAFIIGMTGAVIKPVSLSYFSESYHTAIPVKIRQYSRNIISVFNIEDERRRDCALGLAWG